MGDGAADNRRRRRPRSCLLVLVWANVPMALVPWIIFMLLIKVEALSMARSAAFRRPALQPVSSSSSEDTCASLDASIRPSILCDDLDINVNIMPRRDILPFTVLCDDIDVNANMITRRDALSLAANTISMSILLGSVSIPDAKSTDNLVDEEPPECRNGAIMGESQVPGAYQQICMELPERSIPLKSTGDVITVTQGTGSKSSGGTSGSVQGRTGVAVWNSSLLLTRLLDAVSAQESQLSIPDSISLLRGKTVMELGCGTGLASLAAAKLGASRVIATDGNSEVVQLAKYNVGRNGFEGKVETAELKWGLINAADYYDDADVIIGSDLTYNSGTWRVLAETIGAVLRPDGIVVYLSLGHSGFNISGEFGGFLSVVESEGLELIDESSERWPFKNTVPSMSQLLYKCVTSAERAVLEGNGGARVIVLARKKRR